LNAPQVGAEQEITLPDLNYSLYCFKQMNSFKIILFKGDDKFIIWLRGCCETRVQVSLRQVKTKVGEILASCGQQDVEKTCKWFLL
jgi:hypothetical protein